jgi:hypothetical protein
MRRSYILLAVLVGFATSHANAQPRLSEEVLRPILQDHLIKRYKDLDYITGSSARTPKLDSVHIRGPETYNHAKHKNLDATADHRLPVYPVLVKFTVFDASGGAERNEKGYYCFVTFQKQWGCSPWTVDDRPPPDRGRFGPPRGPAIGTEQGRMKCCSERGPWYCFLPEPQEVGSPCSCPGGVEVYGFAKPYC